MGVRVMIGVGFHSRRKNSFMMKVVKAQTAVSEA